jgi:hypothetical protein
MESLWNQGQEKKLQQFLRMDVSTKTQLLPEMKSFMTVANNNACVSAMAI